MYYKKLIVFTLILFNFNNIAKAGTKEFLDFLNQQNSLLDKSIVCFRVWDITAAVMELVLERHIRNNDPKMKGIANSLFQNKYRAIFLKNLAKAQGLEPLLEKGYEIGVGMDVIKDGKLLEKDCGINVNEFMNQSEYQSQRDAAMQEAREFVLDILRKHK